MQGDEALDPRCYAPVGLEPRTRALLTAVPAGGALLREGRSSRRRRLFWAVTLRAVDGPASGVYAELRLWPESNPEWFQGRLALLCDVDQEAIAALTLDGQRGLLECSLMQRSYAGILETAADGLADVAYLDGPRERADVPADLPEPAATRRVPPPLDVPEAPLPHPPFRLIEDGAALAELCRRLAPATAVAVDIETDCGPLGAPADWSPADGAVRLLQVAARVGGEIVCAVVDCYAVAPRPLVRLLADGREIIAHNARYEQAWLTFHYGLPAWRSVFDTSCAFRVFERHWSIQDPRYVRHDATLATVTRRLLGAPKGDHGADWWGAEPLAPEQLDYAAYDAVALLELRDRAFALAEAFGAIAQVLAASRTACVQAFRRLPQPHADAEPAAVALIDGALDGAALAAAAAVIRRLPLSSFQRATLRERYARRRLAWPPKAA
jgi:3'-5' exonuclease